MSLRSFGKKEFFRFWGPNLACFELLKNQKMAWKFLYLQKPRKNPKGFRAPTLYVCVYIYAGCGLSPCRLFIYVLVLKMGRFHAIFSPFKIDEAASWSPRLLDLLQSNIRFFLPGFDKKCFNFCRGEKVNSTFSHSFLYGTLGIKFPLFCTRNKPLVYQNANVMPSRTI